MGGHSLRLLPNGSAVNDARTALIQNAQRSIFIAAYAFMGDEAGKAIINQLCEKASQGVDVRLLLDSYGSKDLRKRRLEKSIRACGIRLIFFNPPRWALFDVAYVLHEKLFLVDGESVLIGGSGYNNRYRKADRTSTVWHDMDLSIVGPVACWYHKQFVDSWRKSADRTIESYRALQGMPGQEPLVDELGNPVPPPEPFTAKEKARLFGLEYITDCDPVVAGSSNIIPLYANPFFSKARPLLDAHVAAIANSHTEIRLYAPYFIPHSRFAEALLDARQRGVKITILTNSPDSNDENATVMIGMFNAVRKLIRAGVDIRLWEPKSTMHRKGGIYDGKWAYFGSDNLDRRGQEYSSEALAFTDDPELLAQLSGEIDEDVRLSQPLTEDYIDEYLSQVPEYLKWITRIIRRYL